jgi:hypothetical protein
MDMEYGILILKKRFGKLIVTKVFCYRNLNKKGVVWSVRDVKSGLVIDRSHNVYLKNVEMKVSQAGRKRVLKEKRKNVHAGVQGLRLKNKPKNIAWIKARYNPYLFDSFWIEETEWNLTISKQPVIRKISKADYVFLGKNGLWIGWRIK